MTQDSYVEPENVGEFRRRVEELAREASGLKTLAVAFERWHQDMIEMMAQHRELNATGVDLALSARKLIMVSLNAAIEAARAGDSARGFVVVASEVKSLAKGVQDLSGQMTVNLRKGEMRTTATFQDLQAGGKLMMAAISGLESMVNQLRTRIG